MAHINRQIKPLMNQLKVSTKRTPVVLYTMRPQLLQVSVCLFEIARTLVLE
jgi:hypothetical protein